MPDTQGPPLSATWARRTQPHAWHGTHAPCRPKLQLRVVRILWMVPIYAVDSWLSLRFKEAR